MEIGLCLQYLFIDQAHRHIARTASSALLACAFLVFQVPRVQCRRGPRTRTRSARRCCGLPGVALAAPWAQARARAGVAAGRVAAGVGRAAGAAERSPRCSSELRSRPWPARTTRASSPGALGVPSSRRAPAASAARPGAGRRRGHRCRFSPARGVRAIRIEWPLYKEVQRPYSSAF